MNFYIDSYLQNIDPIKIVKVEGGFDVLGKDSHISLDYDPTDTTGTTFSVPYATESQPLLKHTLTGLTGLN